MKAVIGKKYPRIVDMPRNTDQPTNQPTNQIKNIFDIDRHKIIGIYALTKKKKTIII